MTTAVLLEILLAATQHAADIAAIYSRATAEGRDLTDAEVATVRAKAHAANDRLRTQA